MRFSRLRLNGFKSFVDPIDLLITDGLTGVVGPNGCGKSNLLEALRWVMGENRPKSMRGSGMEDVIFAGAATRPARNFAEVSIHIDNTNRLAPSHFNNQDTLEIVRRITRDAGSAYKSNGKDIRARDIQMLFADASTGSHSPALVRQGQIAELINAKPKSRRRILEEAAGISGLYQRRHEAELKLNAAEQNLARVEDVLEQLKNQLSTLARQAKQAIRYREISEELRISEGTLLYGRWKEADLALIHATAELTNCVKTAANAQSTALKITKEREIAENKIPPLREKEATSSALFQRLNIQNETLKTETERAHQTIEVLQTQTTQLGSDISREEALNRDAENTIKILEDEQDRLNIELSGFEDRLVTAEQNARNAADILKNEEAKFDEKNEDIARLSARHQSVQRLIQDSEQMLRRNEEELTKAKGLVASSEKNLEQALSDFEQSKKDQSELIKKAEAAERNLIAAENNRTQIQEREAIARAEKSEAEGSVSTLRAEVTTLEKMLERDTNENERLLDKIDVTEGYETALGAALADDLSLPEVRDSGLSGWFLLPTYKTGISLPKGVKSLNEFVNVPEVLARRISQIGLVDQAQGHKLQTLLEPGQRLVSKEGDLWRWDGYSARSEDAPGSAALKLKQINRLAVLKQDLDESNALAEGSKRAHELLHSELNIATEVDRTARENRRKADNDLTENNRSLSRSESDRDIAIGKLENWKLALSRFQEAASSNKNDIQDAEKSFKKLEDLELARSELEDLKILVETARISMIAERSSHDEIRREGENRNRRIIEITQELNNWRQRLITAEERINDLIIRKKECEAELKNAKNAPEDIRHKSELLLKEMGIAEKKCEEATNILTNSETELREIEVTERKSERFASDAREARARAEAISEGAQTTLDAAYSRITEELDSTPQDLLEKLNIDPRNLPEAEKVDNDVQRLKRQRDALGAVNLRAEEDSNEVKKEFETLDSESSDLKEAIGKLRDGISSLNSEGRERLLSAFDEVNKNFGVLFKHLFGGGEASLMLVESDDPLEAGLEIMCQPPGKKLSTLSLLSGGEQTLTALSLIFAVFLANPSPICVLDEVDAPLDDANVTRFCDLLDEMTKRTDTRFLIITHHAVTMARMDRLFGVTMAEPGVSQLVSVDLKNAEKLVA